MRCVRFLLEARGYCIASAGTVAEVRAAAEAWQPDFVLLNIDLEGRGDGLMLLPELAAQGIRIIIFSGYDPLTARRRWHVPEVPYIEKLCDPDEFVESIARFCPQHADDDC